MRTFLITCSLAVYPAEDKPPYGLGRKYDFLSAFFRLGPAWSAAPNILLLRTTLSEEEIIRGAQSRMRGGDLLVVLDITDCPPAHFTGMMADEEGFEGILPDTINHGYPIT